MSSSENGELHTQHVNGRPKLLGMAEKFAQPIKLSIH